MNRRRILIAGATLAGAGFGARAQLATVTAEVMKIDKATGRVTLKHGEIKSLEMPPMTMAWRVSEGRLLTDLAVGDRVRFVPERINGHYTVTALIKAPQ
jgi:Cu/Ag efflux protein CusF